MVHNYIVNIVNKINWYFNIIKHFNIIIKVSVYIYIGI